MQLHAIARYVLGLAVILALGAESRADAPSREEILARFDTLRWASGGPGPQGRLRAMRAAGHKPTTARPRLEVTREYGKVSVVEIRGVAPRPCPPCPCSGSGASRVCAPCVACRPVTQVRFSATWVLDGNTFGAVTKDGPREVR